MQLKKYSQRTGEPVNLELIQRAGEFLGPRILGVHEWEELALDCRLVTMRKNDFGECYSDDSGKVHVKINRLLSGFDVVVVLAHELVHAKQIVKGESTNKTVGSVIHWNWKGELYKFDEEDYGEDPNYLNSPWEREAYTRDTKLAQEFFSHATNFVSQDHDRNYSLGIGSKREFVRVRRTGSKRGRVK